MLNFREVAGPALNRPEENQFGAELDSISAATSRAGPVMGIMRPSARRGDLRARLFRFQLFGDVEASSGGLFIGTEWNRFWFLGGAK